MKKALTSALAVTALSGCASIVTGHNQSLSVETRHQGQQVVGASCKLNNDKGTWFVTTPGSVMVRRSYDDLQVRCEKEPHAPGLGTVKSYTKGMAFGNVLLGGIVGGAVDIASGAAYDYPSLITVEMGQTSVIEPPKEQAEAPQEGK